MIIQVTAASSTSLTVTWAEPATTGPDIDDYDIQYREGDSGSFTSWSHNSADRTATITNLTPGTAYQVQVLARNAEGASDWSSSGTGSTHPNQPPVFTDGSSATRRLDENTTGVEAIGDPVGATDPENTPLTYSLEGTDADAFAIDTRSGQLRTSSGETYDYETKSRYFVDVKATDGHGRDRTIPVLISLNDLNEAPEFISDAAFEAAENQTFAGLVEAEDLDGADRVTNYTLTGGADQDRFEINSAGVLTFKDAPDFEDPRDNGRNNEYIVVVTATGGSGGRVLTAQQAITVTVTDENEPPAFTSDDAFTVKENERFAGRVAAGDVDRDDAITGYEVTGGADRDDFEIAGTNQLRFKDDPDFERPADAGGSNEYLVEVTATGGTGIRELTATQTVTVIVEDVDEPPGKPEPPTIAARKRNSLTVRWTAPANTGPDIADYGGQYGVAGSGTVEGGWDRVGTATEATVDNLSADTAYEIQVRATSAEGQSGWSEPAEGRTEKNRVPVFGEGSSTRRELAENTAAHVNVGLPVTATDADADRLIYSLERPAESPFTIDSPSGQLKTRDGVAYNHEEQSEHAVTVRVEDGHGGSATIVVTVAILDVENSAITADAGWDLTVAAGGTGYLDGTGSSTEEGELSWSWSLLSWPGDNPPALDDPASPTPSFAAAAEGTYAVRLAVSNGSQSASDEVLVTVRPSAEAGLLVTADLLADTNRDGRVDPSDEPGENTSTEASGALFGLNADDDDGDGVQDGWDDRANGDADLLDTAPVVVRRISGLHRNHSVVLEMAYQSVLQDEFAWTSVGPQLFYQRADGDVELLIAGGDLRAELPIDLLVAGDLRLYIESRFGRHLHFDGKLSLTLTVRDGGSAISQDRVVLRASPILFSHHLQPAERVFVVEIPAWDFFSNTALLDALEAHLPASTELYRLDSSTYDNDRWIQDSMETGYVQRPSAAGVETAAVHTQMRRGRGLHRFLPEEYLSAEVGYVYPSGVSGTSFNYGGNVEVIPPYTHNGRTWSFGRLVIGDNPTRRDWAMDRWQFAFFESQGVQGPPIEVDTSWLTVSHVDELFSALPNHNAAPGERPWVIAIASPALAVELLEEAVEQGYGDAPVFEGRGSDETTAQEMLADRRLMAANDDAQRRIDTVRERLMAEAGLADSDFREVPALFYEFFNEPSYGMLALVPSIQNLLVVDDVLFVSDPEGPDVDGTDIWRRATLDAVEGLGLETHFVDVYHSYHILAGAIHCGTNAERAASTTSWWLGVETEDSE